MATSPKDKFDAAVKVIRGLPKNGSFQPSHDLMLKFYSYFKQATEGPCQSPKPGFWDLVNRKKWEAWAKLGSMEPQEAMLLYVDELKKVSKHVREVYYPPEIVETMPQTDDVSEFLQKLENFYEMVEDSENHNSLTVYKKPALSSDPGDSAEGNHDNEDVDDELENSLNTGSQFDHSATVNQLLQQDIRWWQDRTGVLRTPKSNGDHFPSQGPINGDIPGHGDDRRDRGDYDDVEDDDDDVIDQGLDGDRNLPDTPSTEDWEEVEARASNSGSHSGQSGGSVSESEEENEEEFCDTSDEPAEENGTIIHNSPDAIPAKGSSAAFQEPTDVQAAATSTPIRSKDEVVVLATAAHLSQTPAGAKTVHFDEYQASHYTPVKGAGRDMSDSLLVQASPHGANVMDLSTAVVSGALESPRHHSRLGQEKSLTASSGQPGRVDITVCRGGDGEESDRHSRREEGQGSGGSGSSGRGGYQSGGYSLSGNGRRSNYLGPGGDGGGGGPGRGRGFTPGEVVPPLPDLNEQIVVTLLRLQHDMSGVLNRLNSLEALVKEGRAEREKKAKVAKGWWPLSELSPKSAILIFGWPILLQLVLFFLSRRKRRTK